MTIKPSNNRMQKEPNDFRLKYSKPPKKHNEKAKWINHITREI